MNPNDYCQQKAASSGSSFYYSFLFLPAERRRAIIALYAFCREVDDVVDECSDVGVARLKLQWWREEIGRAFAGEAQHPVTQALTGPIQQYNLPQEYFLEIIDGMEMDLDKMRYADFRELALYCYRVAGVVGLLSAEIFGYQHRDTQKFATELGTALQLTNILRDVREDAQRGRIYLPQDELAQCGVSEAELLRFETTEPLIRLFALQCTRARDYYARALQHLPEGDRMNQRSGLVMAAIYQTVLDEIERDRLQVLEHRIRLTPIRKLWIAWTTARREKRRARRQLKINHAR